MNRIQAYCDGSCPKPHGVGAAAFVILLNDAEVSDAKSFHPATNQTMEMQAALLTMNECVAWGLQKRGITIYSDSQYVVKGMMEWRSSWERRNYKGIMNLQMWKLLHSKHDEFADLEFQWVKGHGSNKWNNMVDAMAGRAQREGLIRFQNIKL